MASRESGLLFSLERGLRIEVWVRQEKKALTSRGWGLLRGFLELRRPWGFFTRQDEDLREPLVRCQGSQVYMRVARGQSLFSRVQLFVDWTIACQALLEVHGILQARILEWAAVPSAGGSSRLRGQACVSLVPCVGTTLTLAPPMIVAPECEFCP